QASGHLARQRAPRHLARQCGLRVNTEASGHLVTRHWIVWLDSGASHPFTRYDSGSLGHQRIRSFGSLPERAPRHLARAKVGTGSPGMTAGSDQLARQRALDQVPDHLDQQRAIESTGLIGSSLLDQFIMLSSGRHAESRGINC
ncbi:unnamed protein product, partial [Staurois parvus]